MTDSLLADPWIAAQIEAAVAPYVGRLPARDLEWMREQLAELLTRDERAARLLRQAHPREADHSGERVVPGGVEAIGPAGEQGAGRTKAG